jgi:LPXTG-site transpeptidase (sortase) family protein
MRYRSSFIIFGILLIVIGIFLLALYRSLSLPLSESFVALANSPSLWPKHISIKSIGVNVGIAPGGYKDGKWILDDNVVLYLPKSDGLGQGGNTILYAHSREKLFGNLKKISVGDVVVLGDANGKIYNYSIYSMEYIKPYQVEKIETNVKGTVTLFTCDGWFDEKRLVVKAIRLGLHHKL